MNLPNPAFSSYSEQDTADKLILPYLEKNFGFPAPSSLDYQAQHFTQLGAGNGGRYDGLYLSGGFPYAILEAKRYSHDLTDANFLQARSYATSDSFDYPVPFLIVSNGREHRFYKRTETIDPKDGKLLYHAIPATSWNSFKQEKPGEVRRLLDEKELIGILLGFKQRTVLDITALFINSSTGHFDLDKNPQLGRYLKEIIEERRKFIGDTDKKDKAQTHIRHAIEAISLHFTTKILFIKLIEDLSAGLTRRALYIHFFRGVNMT